VGKKSEAIICIKTERWIGFGKSVHGKQHLFGNTGQGGSAIAEQFSNPYREQMYVVAYSSRPVLHIKSGEGQRPFALTFLNAIARFGRDVAQDRLEEAYKRAGRAFTGQLEQHFVILKEKFESLPGCSVRTGPTNSRKRPLDGQSMSFERNNIGEGSRGRVVARGRSHWQTKASRR
jgi:hypothetical protein